MSPNTVCIQPCPGHPVNHLYFGHWNACLCGQQTDVIEIRRNLSVFCHKIMLFSWGDIWSMVFWSCPKSCNVISEHIPNFGVYRSFGDLLCGTVEGEQLPTVFGRGCQVISPLETQSYLSALPLQRFPVLPFSTGALWSWPWNSRGLFQQDSHPR